MFMKGKPALLPSLQEPCLWTLGTSPQAAFWDPKGQAWSTEGMGAVSSSGDAGGVTFVSKTIGCFAVVSERTGLLPYQDWHVRPTGGQFGAEAMVAIQTSETAVQLQHCVLAE